MKNYSAITETYLASHGLRMYKYTDYTGTDRSVCLTPKDALRRGFEGPPQRKKREGREATQSHDVRPIEICVTNFIPQATTAPESLQAVLKDHGRLLGAFAALRSTIATEQNLSAVR